MKRRLMLILSGVSLLSVLAVADAASMKDMADSLTGTTSVFAKVMWAACVITGVALVMTSFTQYQIHRQNPKLVPLTNPITYLLIGLVALAIPFIYSILGMQTEDQIKRNPSNLDSYYQYLEDIEEDDEEAY